jgi:hypothetical protein
LLTGGSTTIERLLRRSVRGSVILLGFFTQRRSEIVTAQKRKLQRLTVSTSSHSGLPAIAQPWPCHADEGGIFEPKKEKPVTSIASRNRCLQHHPQIPRSSGRQNNHTTLLRMSK